MSQERLNYLMILHTLKERTDLLDMKVIVNEFISNSENRNSIQWILTYPNTNGQVNYKCCSDNWKVRISEMKNT